MYENTCKFLMLVFNLHYTTVYFQMKKNVCSHIANKLMNHEWIKYIPKSYIYVDDTGTLSSLYKVGLIQTDWCILEEWENIKYIPYDHYSKILFALFSSTFIFSLSHFFIFFIWILFWPFTKLHVEDSRWWCFTFIWALSPAGEEERRMRKWLEREEYVWRCSCQR